jgi:hypothetical protein
VKAAELELECGVGAGAEGRGERGGDRSPGARGGAPARALVPGDIAGQRHALGIRIRIRSRILGRDLLTSCNLLIYGAPYAGSFVTSVSGPRSSPDPVRFCAQYASSTRLVSDSLSDLLRSKISQPPIGSQMGRRGPGPGPTPRPPPDPPPGPQGTRKMY